MDDFLAEAKRLFIEIVALRNGTSPPESAVVDENQKRKREFDDLQARAKDVSFTVKDEIPVQGGQ